MAICRPKPHLLKSLFSGISNRPSLFRFQFYSSVDTEAKAVDETNTITSSFDVEPKAADDTIASSFDAGTKAAADGITSSDAAAAEVDPQVEGDSAVAEQNAEETRVVRPQREGLNRHRNGNGLRNPEKLENIICRMMSHRAWTTRLQNSIRALVPRFHHELVMNVLTNARKADQALQFYRWVERSHLFKHDRETTYKIIQILGRASMLNHARCILFDMPKNGVEWDEDLFIVMIHSYGNAGIVQESVKMFDKMKELGIDRTVKSYNVLFKTILAHGRHFMAKRYYNKMLSEGIEPTLHTYSILIWGFFMSEKVSIATRFFGEMIERGISPNVITYNTMINGYYRVKNIEEAEKIFVEMKTRSIIPDAISYNTMIKVYVSVGKVDDGMRLFEEMKSLKIKPDAFTYSALLPGLCDAQKLSEAGLLLKEMVEGNITPKDTSIFAKLLISQCAHGNLDAASDVLKGMIKFSVPTEAGHYGVLIENFCKVGMYDQAIKVLDKLVKEEIVLNPQNTLEIESSAYNPIIKYLCDHGQTGKAESFFRQLMKKGVPDSVAFNSLIRGHSAEGAPDEAFEIMKIMSRRDVRREADAYILLIESYLKKGEPADAKRALDGMVEDGYVPDSSLFRSVMESLFEDERVQTASRVMKTMLEKGVKDNMDLVAKILEALLMRGHVEEAIGRIELLIQSDCIPDFDSLLSVLCEKQQMIAALQLLEFVLERECNISFSSYEKVLDTLLSAGKTLNAYSVLCKLMQRSGMAREWSSCNNLIKSLNEQGNTKQADTLSRMIKGGDKASRWSKEKEAKKKHAVYA